MMERMRMKPSQIKDLCEKEPFYKKVKVACLALFMGAVSSTCGGYFDNLVFRSGMYQQQMLAGNVPVTNFLNKLRASDLDGEDPFYKPDGNWETSATYSSMTNQGIARREREDWMKLHSMNTIWFDTSACLEGPHIGDINKPDARQYEEVTTWKASYATIGITDDYNWNDVDLYRDFRRDWLDTIEECDVDCQAKGSQLTLIAGLLGLVYFLVGLNALAMFIGTWRYRWRICSVYFTGIVCMFQLAVLIATGVLMFTKYNGICMRSMRKTSVWDGAFIWTMSDDFYMTFSLWIVSFFTMLGFVDCASWQVRREKSEM